MVTPGFCPSDGPSILQMPRFAIHFGTFLVCLAGLSSSGTADEPRLADSLQTLRNNARLTLPAQQGQRVAEHGAIPPAPISDPAPLEMDAARLGLPDSAAGPADSAETSGGPTVSEGAVETIRERYPNRSVKVERSVTQDSQGNYVNHGPWKMWDERGNLVAEGQYEMGARTGRWTRWHRRGESPLFKTLPFSQGQGPFISQATFENDALEGTWTIYDAKQRQLSRLSFVGGQRHGPATLRLPSGQVIRQMNYRHGDLHGEVMELSREGQLEQTATYQHGRRLAKKTSYFKGSRSRQTEAVYLFAKLIAKTPDDFWTCRFAEYEPAGKDERHGEWKTWYPNGQVQVQGQYEHDLPVGLFSWWHRNGQKFAEGEYVDGQQNGRWVWWHPNGQKWTEGEFRRGEQTGEWSSWTEAGRLDQQARYSGSHRAPATAVVGAQEEDTRSSRKMR